MRLIDADALKKEWNMADKCEDCPRDARDCQFGMVLTRMDVCQMLDDAPTVTGWVSVNDRLPDEDRRYLCWFGKNKALIGAGFAWYLSEKKAFWDLEYDTPLPNITHWMPLPEPPEEEHHEV